MTAGHYADIGEIGRPIGEDPKGEPASTASLEQRLAVAEAEKAQALALLDQQRHPKPPPRIDPANLPPEDPGEMPDPSTQPDEFRLWTERARNFDDWKSEQKALGIRDEAQRSNRSKEIVDQYLASRPKYQHLRAMVVQCYRDACDEGGISALPDNTTALDNLVDAKMRPMVQAAAAAVDTLPTGEPKEEVTPPGRTAGLSGASTGAPAGSKAPKGSDEPAPIPLVEVMKQRQADSGFF